MIGFPVNGMPAFRVGYRGHIYMCIHLADILVKTLLYFMQLKTRWKSARFHVEEYFTPYPGHYSRAFAFSILLCPHRPQHALRFACPVGQRYGFTRFRLTYKRSGRALSIHRRSLCPCALGTHLEQPNLIPFGSGLTASLACCR